MKHFGQTRLHPRALTGRHQNNPDLLHSHLSETEMNYSPSRGPINGKMTGSAEGFPIFSQQRTKLFYPNGHEWLLVSPMRNCQPKISCQAGIIRLQEIIMPKKSLVIDIHHHWMPDEHYRRLELHVHRDEEVIHEADRFRIQRAGVQLFGQR